MLPPVPRVVPAARFESAAADGRGWNVSLNQHLRHYEATRIDDVRAVLAEADRAARQGLWAAVVVSYEAAPAFDSAVRVRTTPDLPLVQVDVYGSGEPAPEESPPAQSAAGSFTFEPVLTMESFAARVRAAQHLIAEGDIYQVNLTFPVRTNVRGGIDRYYESWRRNQQAPYCARLSSGDRLILSISPELFFSRTGDVVVMQPMKGTSRRGRWRAEDERLATELTSSLKERAENVMIVDVMRNDIGRLAKVGSVRTPRLFEAERYPTLWQMTSTVEAEVPSHTTIVDLFTALFPSASITGAPKIAAMEVIAEQEAHPRGIYTGAIGVVLPGGNCTFNVAIRTIVVDLKDGQATMGVGAGITTDSVPELEYRESLLKAQFLTPGPALQPSASFALLETMRLDESTIPRLDRHLQRMADSARYFSFPWNESAVRGLLRQVVATHRTGLWRLRLTLDHRGTPDATCTTHEDQPDRMWRVARSATPIDPETPLLFNKTTARGFYDAARASRADADDVLLWNARGEVTESTIANLVVEIDGTRYTPPVACGVLPGVLRGELLEQGDIVEGVLTFEDLARASRLWLLNSLRGWMPAVLVR